MEFHGVWPSDFLWRIRLVLACHGAAEERAVFGSLKTALAEGSSIRQDISPAHRVVAASKADRRPRLGAGACWCVDVSVSVVIGVSGACVCVCV